MRDELHDLLETVYAGVTARGEVGGVWATGDPPASAAWACHQGLTAVRPLTGPLPVALAEEIRAALTGSRPAETAGGGGPASGGAAGGVETLVAQARRELRRRGLPERFPGEAWGVRGEGLPPGAEVEAVRAALVGRRLYASELLRQAVPPGGNGPAGRLYPEGLSRALTFLRLAGEVGSVAAVGRDPDGTWRCRRCGGARIQPLPCANCGDPACPACPDCLLLGEARACRRLYFLPDRRPRPSSITGAGGTPPTASPPGPPPGPPGRPLTPAQRRAAEALLDWLGRPGAPAEALLWAVCGAGKTPVARPVVEQALASGWRVLYASPRRQVLRQVAADLPRTGLILATTHQVLRYQEAFDLVVVDEPDAYPFRGNPLLRAGLQRAAKAGASWLYLTATPEPELVARVETGEVFQVLLPRRFHGRPAPVPHLLTPAGQGITALAAEVIKTQLGGERRFLVFAPTVALCHGCRAELAALLNPEPAGAAGPGVTVAAVDAGTPGRDEVIAAFRRGEVQVLVSTTVLERGVTFPQVDVLVVHADHPLFDRVSLLQMAGRAGRLADDPTGEAWFVGRVVSPEMAAARQWALALSEAAG